MGRLHCFISCLLLQLADAPVEPPACWEAFSAEAGGLHCSWGGQRERPTAIGVYKVQNEQWTVAPTIGPTPPRLWEGGCAIISNHLFCFGGYNGSSPINDLHKLNLGTFQWSKVLPKNNSSEQPICKKGCGLTAVSERTLACFGGYGCEPRHVQPGSTFTRDKGSDGWTNEYHLFDIQKGIIVNSVFVQAVLISLSSCTTMLIHMSCSTHS